MYHKETMFLQYCFELTPIYETITIPFLDLATQLAYTCTYYTAITLYTLGYCAHFLDDSPVR